MTTTRLVDAGTIPVRPDHVSPVDPDVERLARAIVDTNGHFYRRGDRFDFVCRGDVLIIRGNVPSFYLKQVLQTALLELNGICRIDNQVSVVSSFGLSSFEANDE
jgi:hypothetical protein